MDNGQRMSRIAFGSFAMKRINAEILFDPNEEDV